MAPTQQQIYARRRALALLVALLLALTVWGFSSLGSNQQAEPTPTSTSVPVTESASTEIADCQAGAVVVQARIGDESGPRTSFDSGEKPMIWYSITNVGLEACNFNAGSRVTFFTITSGGETYWSSKDCDRTADVDQVITLASNQSVESPKGVWERVRSGSEGCGVGLPEVPAGGASYFLKVEVNGVYSEDNVQFLLN